MQYNRASARLDPVLSARFRRAPLRSHQSSSRSLFLRITTTITESGEMRCLCSPADLGHPPAEADHQEPPVVEKLGSLALDGMAHELKDPADRKQRERDWPQSGHEERDNEQQER